MRVVLGIGLVQWCMLVTVTFTAVTWGRRARVIPCRWQQGWSLHFRVQCLLRCFLQVQDCFFLWAQGFPRSPPMVVCRRGEIVWPWVAWSSNGTVGNHLTKHVGNKGCSSTSEGSSHLNIRYVLIYSSGEFTPASLPRHPRRDITYSTHNLMLVYWIQSSVLPICQAIISIKYFRCS